MGEEEPKTEPAAPPAFWRRKPVLLGAAAVVVVAAVVLALVLTGNSDEPTKAAPANTRPAPTVKPLRLAEKPLWTSPPEARASDVEALDDLMLMHLDEGLSLVDATTGTPRWTFEKNQLLAGGDGANWQRTFGAGLGTRHLVPYGDGVGVLVEYHYTADCTNPPGHPDGRGVCHASKDDETGLALLSEKDGSVIWKAPTIPEYPEVIDYDTLPGQILRAVDDRVAVVSINGLYATAESYEQGTQATIAIDIRTGQKLWERNYGVWPEKIVGDVVVGQVSKRIPGSGLAPEPTDGTVMALDLTTGHPRWELSKRYKFSQIVAVAGDAILVHGQSDDGKRGFVVLDAGTGREVTKFPGKDVAGCDSDGQTLIACLHQNVNSGSSAFEVNTYDVADRAVTTTVSGTGLGFRLWDVWANRIEVVEHKGEDALNYTMDKHGNRIDEDPPGGIATVTADRAILFTKDDSDTTNTVVAVYEVLS